MSLQTIIDKCTGISINRRKMIGIQFTRNEIPRISETPTKNPWRITLTMPNSLRYSEARAIIESIDNLDRRNPEVITFNNNSKMNWIFAYQGVMSVSQISNLRVTSFNGNQLVLSSLPVTGANRVLFAAGDLIQIGSFPYPFTVVSDVYRGTDATVTVTTHRPNILSNDVIGLGIVVGAGCQFRVFCPNMPTYKLIPGGSLFSANGVMTNNAYLEWSDNFELYEYVGLA